MIPTPLTQYIPVHDLHVWCVWTKKGTIYPELVATVIESPVGLIQKQYNSTRWAPNQLQVELPL